MNLTDEEVIRGLEEEKSILEWVRDGMGVCSEKTKEKLRNHPKLKDDYIRADRRIEALTQAIQSLKDYEELKKVVDVIKLKDLMNTICQECKQKINGCYLTCSILPKRHRLV